MTLRRFAPVAVSMAMLAGLMAVPSLGSAGAAAPQRARAAGTCRIAGREQSLGPTYVTYVGVSGGASCTQALRLVRSFYHCRLAHGGVRGRCASVEGFRCSESRYASIAVQFDSRVLCTRGSERVRHNYTQFT
jgi:hypothetical protein